MSFGNFDTILIARVTTESHPMTVATALDEQTSRPLMRSGTAARPVALHPFFGRGVAAGLADFAPV